MTTDSTKPVGSVAEGEPMLDLIAQLDALAARSNSTNSDRIPVHEFYRKLNRIHAEACRRLGESPEPVRSRNVPGPNFVPDEEDFEDALAFWMVTRSKAENRKRGRSHSNEEIRAEFEDEVRVFEEVNCLDSVFDE